MPRGARRPGESRGASYFWTERSNVRLPESELRWDGQARRPVLLHYRRGLAGEFQHPGGEDAQEEGAERGHHERDAQTGGQGLGGGGGFARFVHVHHYQDPQVVVGRHGAVQQAENGQPIQVAVQRRLEDVELAEEAAGGRDGDGGEQEDGEQGGGEGLLTAQALEIVNALEALALAGEHGDGGEGSHIHERVPSQVEHGGGGAGLAARGEGHQDVAGVRDGTVGQHALDVGLQQRGEIADAHGCQRAAPYQRLPADADGFEGGGENAQEDGECGGFRAGGEKCGDGRRRALVDVGGPDLEGRGGDLEGETNEHQGGGHGQEDRVGRPQNGGANQQQVDAAGDAVDDGHAVQEEGGGEAAEQEIFECGFVAALIVAQIAGQDVTRDGGDLQADEDHDQVVGSGHQALAGDTEQQQRVVLAGFGVLLGQEAIGRQNGQHADHDQRIFLL